jgi:precorrin-4/cobalt-precorrin-4 C11-methyltransferase
VTGGKVYFVGGGPGAADLLTLRAARTIAEADVVIWGRSLLMEDAISQHVRPGAELVTWPPATLDDVLAAYDRASEEGLTVVRMKSGDPAFYGEMDPELAAVRERGLAFEIVPGVSSLGAAAAALGCELARSGGRDLLVLGGAAGVEALTRLDRGTTLALLAAGSPGVAAKLLDAGLDPATPCAIAHRVSWPDELLAGCRLDELDERLEDLGLAGLTLVLAGPALADPAVEV